MAQSLRAIVQFRKSVKTGTSTSPLCALFDRPLPFSDRSPANFPTRAYSRSLNIATLNTKGVDIEMNYDTDLGPGHLTLRNLTSYQPTYVTVNFPGSPRLDRGGAATLPAWRISLMARYDLDPFSVDILQRWHSATRRSSDPAQVFSTGPIPDVFNTDVTLSYKFDTDFGETQAFLTVQNLWDQQPPIYVNTGAASTVPGFFVPVTNGDDAIGRYFTAGIRFRN